MKKSPAYLSQLVASRLNHDYVAPMTAISNSCELMQISPSATEECVELINETVSSAISLLQLYRLGFGSYVLGDLFSVNDVRRYLQEVFGQRDFELELSLSSDAIERADAKLIVLAALCLRSSFMKMRSLRIEQDASEWIFQADGAGAINDAEEVRAEGYWNDTADWKSSEIHFPLFHILCEEMSLEFVRKTQADHIALRIWPK